MRLQRPLRHAFTLVEVAVSLLIVSVAIVAAMLAFPAGVRAQRLSRFSLLASAKVLSMIDTFAQGSHEFVNHQTEAAFLGQNTVTATPVDFDTMMASGGFDLLPLPTALVRRLDAGGDEIATILSRGGTLFYASPHPHKFGYEPRWSQIAGEGDSVHGTATASRLAPEVQSLVFGVVGYAQQNALPNHPCLAWPYYDFYPSPLQEWEYRNWSVHRGEPGWSDAWSALDALHARFAQPAIAGITADAAAIDAYVRAAQDLVTAALPAASLTLRDFGAGDVPVPNVPQELSTFAPPWPDVDDVRPRPWRVLAIRLLAHAATMRTGGLVSAADPAAGAHRAYARATHDSCMAWCMRSAAADPYDWGAPRSLNRQLAWDHPLLQFDLFASAAFPDPVVTAPDGTGDVSWRVVAPRPPRDYGVARGYRGFASIWNWADQQAPSKAKQAVDDSWGDHAHFNLTHRFSADERCRQIVCWSVDWLSYEDAEELPAAPLDARQFYIDSRGAQVSLMPVALHPEHTLFWADERRQAIAASWIWENGDTTIDESVAFKRLMVGAYGADRDGDGRFRRGPLPRSARLRATEVARFDFYDRRAMHALRD